MQLTKMSTNPLSAMYHAGKNTKLTIQQLGERSTLGGLLHIPLDNILVLQTDLPERIDRAGSTPAKCTNHQRLDVSDTTLAEGLDALPDVLDHRLLVIIRLQILQHALSAFLLLPNVGQRSRSSTSESSVEPEGGDTSSGFGVFEEFEVVQQAIALSESTEDVAPAGLLLVAVGEGDVGVGKGIAARRLAYA